MATPLTKFLPFVSAEAPGAGEPMLIDAIRDSCIEFCELSHAVRMTLDPVDLEVGVSEYEIAAPPGLAILRAMDVWLRGRKIAPTAPGDVRDPEILSGAVVRTGTPSAVVFVGGGSVIVDPAPNERVASGLIVRASLKPKRDSASVPDELYEDFVDTIASGALARLMAAGGNLPFANPGLAVAKRAMFRAGVLGAMLKASTGGQATMESRARLRRI